VGPGACAHADDVARAADICGRKALFPAANGTPGKRNMGISARGRRNIQLPGHLPLTSTLKDSGPFLWPIAVSRRPTANENDAPSASGTGTVARRSACVSAIEFGMDGSVCGGTGIHNKASDELAFAVRHLTQSRDTRQTGSRNLRRDPQARRAANKLTLRACARGAWDSARRFTAFEW
jgi:hypothetical protein